MIYFDIDGVIRDLATATFGFIPPSWDHLNEDGIGFCDIIHKDLDILKQASPLSFIKLVNELPEVIFLSAQFPTWVSKTDQWLDTHITTKYKTIYSHSKLDYLKPDDLLIEDSPLLSDYSQIALVVWPYNKHIDNSKCHSIINSYDDFNTFLQENY